MSIRTARTIAASSLLAAGLVAWSGCNAENPDGTPTTVGKIEAGAEKAGEKIKEGAIKATDATGKAIEDTGKKLETDGKESVEKHVGEKAGAVVEGAGKGMEKAGAKIQEAVKKPD